MAYFDHSFEGCIQHHHVGSYRYTVVFLPPEIAGALPFDRHPRMRISGEVGDVPFAGAWQPVKGRWYLMLSKPLLKAGGFKVGDLVEVRFRVEAQDTVAVPDALRRALERDRTRLKRWEALSPGKRRGLAHRVASARTLATEQKRVAEVLEALTGRGGPVARSSPARSEP